MLTTAFNQYLALDPEAPEKLKAFDGKLIAIDVKGPNLKLYLSVDGDKVSIASAQDAEPDATIIGSPAALFKLGKNRDSAPLFFKGEVEIRGDTRLGRQFKALLTDMEIDWEEHLSRVVGDVAAHRFMEFVNELNAWGSSAASNFADDVGEYLQEESRDVVSGAELEEFYQYVDQLRDDVERLMARYERLVGNK